MREVDLNLLPQLQALLELRNVSRAAERRQMSQSAMSSALARLRRHFNDELLVRTGRGYELTSFATTLAPQVEQAMAAAQAAMQLRTEYDPRTSDRTFVVAASDYVTVVLLRHLRAQLAAEAPGVSVDFVPSSRIRGTMEMFTRLDLAVGPVGFAFDGRSRHLFRDEFVVVMSTDHDLLRQERLTLTDLASAPQAMGDFGPGIMTPPMRMFQDAGLQPNVAARVAGFQSLPTLVGGTDLVAVVPRMLAARTAHGSGVAIVPFSDDLEIPLVEALFWHPLQDRDAANGWLRDVVRRAAREMDESFAAEPLVTHPVTVSVA